MGFGLEGEAHTEYIAHRFLQRIVAFEMRVRIDVSMDFHVDIILTKEVAQLVGNFDAFGNFYQHTFFDRILVSGLFVVNEHETAMSLT